MSNKKKSKDYRNSKEKNEEANWENVTKLMGRLSSDPKFQHIFPLKKNLIIVAVSLDYFDDGVDLSDPHQLYTFVYGATNPLKMMLFLYKDGKLEFEPIRHSVIAFSAVLMAVYNYLPREHFAPFMDSDYMDTEGR